MWPRPLTCPRSPPPATWEVHPFTRQESGQTAASLLLSEAAGALSTDRLPRWKNPQAVQETQVQSLGREDPLEKGMATHPNILAWRIPMDRRARWATVHGVAESDRTEQLTHNTY